MHKSAAVSGALQGRGVGVERDTDKPIVGGCAETGEKIESE